MRKRTVSTVLAVLLASGLCTGCGGKDAKPEGNTPTKTRTLATAQEAFQEPGVWLYSYDTFVTKDSAIDYVLVFDGDGNVTNYQTSPYDTGEYLTYGDLQGLSEDEIIELAKESDREHYEADMQHLRDVFHDPVIDHFPYNTEEEFQAFVAEAEQKMEANEYQEPQPQPFTLRIETDGTGNNTAKEVLSYPYHTWQIFFGEGWFEWPDAEWMSTWNVYRDKERELDLLPGSNNMTVYDKQFNGFQHLNRIVDDGCGGFVLDKPGTEGIKVD